MKEKLSHYNKHKHKKEIEVKNFSFSYSKNKKILDNVNIDIHQGEWTTIIGPNGSGKSTLAKNIVRVLKRHQEGSILVDGKDIKDFKNKEFARRVAYIPQMIEVPDGTSVFDYVSFGRNPWLGFTSKLSQEDKEIIDQSLQKAGALEWKDKMIEDLSGGQRQRVVVAMAIAQTAQTIILDEPTTYLDIKAQYELLELMNQLHQEGKTIITVIHDINQAVQYSDEVVVLSEGRVHSYGTPEKVITEKMLQDVFKVNAKLHKSKDRKFLTDVKILDKGNV